MKAGKLVKFLINCFNPEQNIFALFIHADIMQLMENYGDELLEIDIVSSEKFCGQKFPKLFSLRCFANENGKLFQSWEFSDYLEYCDTLAHIFNEYNGERIIGCYFQSVVVFSGGFELVIWEKRYD